MSDTYRILALDIAGNPHKWISYEDSCYYYAKGLIGWQMGDQDKIMKGGTNAASGLRSQLDINSIIAIKGALVTRIAGYENPPLNNRSLFKRDNCTCAYCGDIFPQSKLTRDHVFPVSRGGPNIWENVVACCSHCNKVKDNRTPTEANMPLKFKPYMPNRAEYLMLNNGNVLDDQKEFLMKRIGKDSRLRGKD